MKFNNKDSLVLAAEYTTDIRQLKKGIILKHFLWSQET